MAYVDPDGAGRNITRHPDARSPLDVTPPSSHRACRLPGSLDPTPPAEPLGTINRPLHAPTRCTESRLDRPSRWSSLSSFFVIGILVALAIASLGWRGVLKRPRDRHARIQIFRLSDPPPRLGADTTGVRVFVPQSRQHRGLNAPTAPAEPTRTARRTARPAHRAAPRLRRSPSRRAD